MSEDIGPYPQPHEFGVWPEGIDVGFEMPDAEHVANVCRISREAADNSEEFAERLRSAGRAGGINGADHSDDRGEWRP